MFGTDLHEDDAKLIARAHTLLDQLQTQSLTGRTDEQVLALWRELESVKRRFAPVDHALINQATHRRLDYAQGAKTMTVLARDVLRVSASEATGRVRAAEALGPRTGLSGEALEPIYPAIAAGQAAGVVSDQAARVIVRMIEKLPHQIRCDKDRQIEAFLTEQAGIFDLDALRHVARRLADTLNPDGSLDDADHRRKHRELTLHVRPDGSGRLEGDLTAELTEHLRVLFDTVAKPTPETDGSKDPRTAGQRRHDALLSGLKLLERADQLPHSAGVSATVILTMTAEAYATGEGTATTSHGVVIPASEGRQWSDGDARLIGVVFDRAKRIVAYSDSRRLFTENQRLAMAARDRGCSFPSCDAPVHWTEAHHVLEYSQGGRTRVDEGTLLCCFHHDNHQAMGWSCVMIQGVPHWIPPKYLDPTRTPRRNTTHDPAAELDLTLT